VTLRNISRVIRPKYTSSNIAMFTFYARVIFAAGAGVREGGKFPTFVCDYTPRNCVFFAFAAPRKTNVCITRNSSRRIRLIRTPPSPYSSHCPVLVFPDIHGTLLPVRTRAFPVVGDTIPSPAWSKKKLGYCRETARRYVSVDIL